MGEPVRRRVRLHQIASVLIAHLVLATVLGSFSQSQEPSSYEVRSPANETALGGSLDNFSLSASFVASLQAADGGMEEAEDNNYENTDNTLEAIWIWCRYYRATADNRYFPNVLLAWNYSVDHPAWTESDSGRVYSSAWALLAEQEYRKAYGRYDMMWYANQSASYIITRNGWEDPFLPFDTTAKRHIKGWGAGALYKWATQLGNVSAAQSAVTMGDQLRALIESNTSVLSSESWALAGGASFWGVAITFLAENPNASWIEYYAPFLKTEVTSPGSGPGNSQNGWEAWYALGWWAAHNATGNQTFLDIYRNITNRLISRDGDRDGGVPTNVGDPDDGDESWVTAYRAYFCLRQGIRIYDLRPPGPPEIMSIEISDSSNVTLTWNLSSDDGAGTGDVFAYEMFTSEVFNSSGAGYELLATLVNGTSNYVHLGAGSDAKTHFYFVIARDFQNFTSRSEQAVKFSKVLPNGPNLLCVPLLEGNVPIEEALTGIHYDFVRAFSGSNGRPWLLFSQSRGYSDLRFVNSSMAVWVNVTSPSELVMTGLVPSTTTLHFNVGWNLMGFSSFAINYSVSRLKAELPVFRVEGYSELEVPYHLKILGDMDTLSAGNGYWIRTETSGSITIFT
jgi:hypothetical protein